VGGLTALHTYLLLTNQTTYEHFRHKYNNQGNPYDEGLPKNCVEVFCSPTPPPMRKRLRATNGVAPGARALVFRVLAF
jgi:hypothetical protein